MVKPKAVGGRGGNKTATGSKTYKTKDGEKGERIKRPSRQRISKASSGGEIVTQKEYLLHLFKLYNNKLTLREIMGTSLAAEYRARISEVRRAGFNIVCKRGKAPSDNEYELIGKGAA